MAADMTMMDDVSASKYAARTRVHIRHNDTRTHSVALYTYHPFRMKILLGRHQKKWQQKQQKKSVQDTRAARYATPQQNMELVLIYFLVFIIGLAVQIFLVRISRILSFFCVVSARYQLSLLSDIISSRIKQWNL